MTDDLAGLDGGFERIKIRSGGAVFEVRGKEPGETDAVKEFTAVILYHHPQNIYYQNAYAGGNAPSDCGSYDGVTGIGTPGAARDACPHNQFGSATSGGKACKAKRRLFVLREGEFLPLVMNLPTGSLKEFGRYIKRLLGKCRKSNAVPTARDYLAAVQKNSKPLVAAEVYEITWTWLNACGSFSSAF